MSTTFNILLAGALFCVLMLLVLGSLIRSGIPGIKEWCLANVFACTALLLHAFADALPPVADMAAPALHAASVVMVLAGFRHFLGRRMQWFAASAGAGLLVGALAILHYLPDVSAWRSAAIGLFEGSLSLAIAFTVLRARKSLRLRFPHLLSAVVASLVALGNVPRIVQALFNTGEMPIAWWDGFFLSMDALILPTLSFGAVMMVHARMMAQAEQAANRDFLTGAWSRSAFLELVDRELSRARRTRHALSLLLIDVDHFKHINDSYGHAGGDQVLIDVALRAEAVLREIDYFARIGGGEFAVLLPETDRYAAQAAAERLRLALDTKPAGVQNMGTRSAVPYTVSIGVASLRDADSHSDLMRRADAALYTAKAIGRNRVVSESD
ncbi:GGDEF domain-containing protein [Noviherbaspirillum sp.]|jgi:diguanylate cyclase (GGDEF)-like protein|uniref:GGDEF domain-containing protein n=1 Tax=Noviherbaspirillum sp. TaxID=1926288 RepID=UPI0025EEA5F1|nr:GGDEF domain-containing protein [Noviherbaspirillum sp.]